MPTIVALINGVTPPWQTMVALVVLLALVPGLLVRQEYRDALLSRILVTIGVVAALVPLLVPNDGGLPLVNMFKALMDAPGKDKVLVGVSLAYVIIVVLCLLAWLPAPSSAAAKVLAWLVILWPLVVHLTAILLHADQLVDALTNSPNFVLFGPLTLEKEAGAAIPVGWAVQAAYAAITAYGLATVFGKQLE